MPPEPSAELVESTPEYRKRIKGEGAAQAYKHRKLAKHLGEVRLVEKGLRYLPTGGKVLDAPCGNGRMTVLLAKAGFRAMGIDLSDGTLSISRTALKEAGLEAELLKSDLEKLDLPDKHVDGTLCFRFYHHLPDQEIRKRVIDELCRVTSQTILISYLSAWSPTMLKRRLRLLLGGKKSKQHTTTLADLEAFFRPHGFVLRESFAQKKWIHSLHLACFTSEKTA